MTGSGKRLGILVSGGPAPGINSAISATTIEARNSGLSVLGIFDGFEHLIAGDTESVTELTIEDVSRIHFQGGSVLRTARANPARDDESLNKVVDTLRQLGISYLVTIGGDDTAFAASWVAERAGGTIRVAHIPKTIDNDLPLPTGMPTFGYETARSVGTQIALTIMEDSRTINRWFVMVVMGRKAGHLALGIGKAAGATVTVIPEEFPKPHISFDQICRVVEGSIIKRRLTDQDYGVAIVAEGTGEKLDPAEMKEFSGVEPAYDAYGNIALADLPLASLLKHRIQKRFAARGDQIRLTDVTLGYELRSTNPIPFDIDYTRTLGYGAVRFLLSAVEDPRLTQGGLVTLDGARLRMMPFSDLLDPQTGRTRVRLVDIESEHYRVARDYMIRLESRDFAQRDMTERLAAAAHMSFADFKSEFGDQFAG